MSTLHHLSDLAGVLPEYYDIRGQRHETSDDTRHALLRAMGLVGDNNDIDAGLESRLAQAWSGRLPPVQVERANAPLRITLRLPEQAATRTWRWRLNLEQGGERAGTCIPAQLESLDQAEIAGQLWQARALDLPGIDVIGYHRLEISDGEESATMPLIVTPERCHLPEAVRDGRRVWGLSTQLYGVRSASDWGIGDFSDLVRLIEWAAEVGAGLIGVNPLHALFPHNPRHASPYSPSSRRFLNSLYLDVAAVPEFAECAAARERVASAEFQARQRALRDAAMVDYAGVAAAKEEILVLLHRQFRTLDRNAARQRDYQAWRLENGAELERFVLYLSLQEHLYANDSGNWGWPAWPEAYRDPESAEVEAFAAAHEERLDYYRYRQWLAETQLDQVGARARELGLGVGLYRDLAVGVDLGGAETWSQREQYALGARIGCPPDDFNLLGQDWGLPPWNPERLRTAGYAPFIAMLRANMRGAGALRLDHVMGLLRLYWVPPGMRGDQGAYIAYPFRDLLGILALESQRNHCLIVGEDLGTVPDEVRAAMHEMDILSYRLFYFERAWDGAFQPPEHYPEAALVAASTHDLPPLAGYWRGQDLDLRDSLGLFPDEAERGRQTVARAEDRARLLEMLEREGLLPGDVSRHPEEVPELTPDLSVAIHRHLARSPAKIALVQAEDLLGETEQVNLPGTTDAYPNWQRKLSVELEHWAENLHVRKMTAAMREERG
jgi:(1->4)-alpha-D-glucan 1-alpha-D-glucosylmutase